MVFLVIGMASDPERKDRGDGNVLSGDYYTDVYFIIQYNLYVLCTFLNVCCFILGIVSYCRQVDFPKLNSHI